MASLVQLSADQLELQERARRFVDEVLIPHEVAAERAGGRLPADVVNTITKAAIEASLNGGRHGVEHGGQGWSTLDYVVVHEQLGRNTNGLWWWIPCNSMSNAHRCSYGQFFFFTITSSILFLINRIHVHPIIFGSLFHGICYPSWLLLL